MKFLWVTILAIGAGVSISLLFSGSLGGFLLTLIVTSIILAIVAKIEENDEKKSTRATHKTSKTR